MKSFRLYLRPPVITPVRFAGDYQTDELDRFRAEFRPVAERYRRRARISYLFIALGAACVLVGLASPVRPDWPVGGFVACWLALALMAIWPAPTCPACHNGVSGDLGPYCPDCGAQAVQQGGWLRVPHCNSCKIALHWRRRLYTIRACTHCGVPLDDKGI